VTRTIFIGALGLSALLATAAVAAGAPVRALAPLDCPATQGSLTRTAQAADGATCDYQGPVGETVRLRRVSLDGRSATDAMAPTKAELRALVPIYNRPVPAVDRNEPGDRADIDLPFFHVHTRGDHAEVRMFGVKVHSEGENADVDVGHGHKHAVVHAGADGAEVLAEDVGRTRASMVYVLAADHRQASGFWTVGYVAKGPAAGPLVVGEFRSIHKHSGHEGNIGDHDDIGRLIDRNVRG
jgi:hypothetical protein